MTDIDPRRGFPSASAMHRIAECPGSLALVNKLRAEGRLYELPDPARTTGIRIHRWLKLHSLGERDIEAMLTPTELGTAQQCLELRDQKVDEWFDSKKNGKLETIVEWRLWYRQGLWARFTGQPDFAQIDHGTGRALVVNYKTGRLEAEEAADNLQLRTEVVLVKHNWPDLVEIAGTIIEPNVTWSPETVIYQGQDFITAESEILEIVTRAELQKTRRIAGPWCGKCPAAAHCQEALDYINRLPGIPDESVIKLPRGKEGTDFWERIKVAKKLIYRLEEIYTNILEMEPDALPGYILPKEGKVRRYVPFPRKFKDALADYLSEDEIDGCAEYYLGRVEELLGIKHRIAGKELGKFFKKLTQGVVEIRHDAPFIRPLTKGERATNEEITGGIRLSTDGPR